ncbi:MAG TPA: pentapeptide repeat-containing protein [Candidatus Rubrimentiphilum sp.]|nr:pentapeptide repeat-containing protein [Candidatus Rubrimentiphilum sp.]
MRRRLFAVVALLAALLYAPALAQSPTNLVGANMQGKNLQNADLHNANLQNADLQGANLRGANLSGANLRGANLLGAHLGAATLTGAILQNSNLQHLDSESANFQNANLQQANLQGADLQNAVLTGADLYGANLTRANLFGVNLQNADLQTANLHGANLHNAALTGANLQQADLQNTNLVGTTLTGAQLLGANLHGAKRSAPSAIAAVTPPAAATPLPGPPTTPPRIYSAGPRPYAPPPRTYSAPSPAPVAAQASFANVPFGQVPILFNDHTVHTNDVLSRDRVLAALVRGSAILVPLRAMLAQMGGAQVAYDASSKTITIDKAGARIVLTLGVPRVIVNDKVHPLDVAPMLYEGEILVPIRVISEGLGGYVQWVADQRVVVVRYTELAAMLPPRPPSPTPSPGRTPEPQAAPPPAPTPTPTPLTIARRHANSVIVSADYMNAPAISNEAAPAHTIGNQSFSVHGTFLMANTFLVQFAFNRYRFPHNAFQQTQLCDPAPTGCTTVNALGQYQTGVCPGPDPGCVTAVGSNVISKQTGRSQEYVTAFNGVDTDVDLRAALKILKNTYAGIGFYGKHYSYLGYPIVRGVGFGISKMPNLDKQLSLFASVWYYPAVTGKYTYPVSPFLGPFSGQTVPFGYSVLKYRAGATFWLNQTNLFLEAGWAGEVFNSTINTPGNAWTEGSFFGIGTRFP